MGATTFLDIASGVSAKEAFNNAYQKALMEYGHRGYTGTIAEKDGYVMITVPEGIDARAYANQLLDDDDARISDKWGPAGCIKLSGDKYMFFGWASE